MSRAAPISRLGSFCARTASSTAAAEPSEEQTGIEDDPALVEREVTFTDDREDTDVEPEATVRGGTMAASSLGLAFSVRAEVDAVTVTASWGRYVTGPSQVHETEHGRPRTVWRRIPAGGQVRVSLKREEDEVAPDPEQEPVSLSMSHLARRATPSASCGQLGKRR